MNFLKTTLAVAAASIWMASPVDAVIVDGQLDPEYGPALSTQTTQTSLGDQVTGFEYFAAELDGAFGFVVGGNLHLLFSGSFDRFYSEPLILPNQLQIYLDVGTGGQNPLRPDLPHVGFYVNLQEMSGMGFDSEFTPDYWLAGSMDGGGGTNSYFAYYAELPATGGGAGYFLGSTTPGGPGNLTGPGSNNPHGILSSVDLSNRDGVTGGCEAASGEGVTTGMEWAVPLAAIGNPSGPIRVCAVLVGVGAPQLVSNQVLGPVPPGTCGLGGAGTVNFENIAGAQFFTVTVPTPAVTTSWGKLKTTYR
ncbi:MAG: hypothetical protein ACREOU_09250 [Candidatus Eiseniibacteriota bacterium]